MSSSNQNPLISVIIPVYNVEAYLKKCLDSVLAQSYTNLELILIDDGSTDNSGSICDRYVEEHSNIRVLHTSNNGLSEARNLGLKNFSGDYFAFIDSDDYIRCDYFELLYKYIVQDNADISNVAYKKIVNDCDTGIVPDCEAEYQVHNREETQFLMMARKIPTYAHGKLFRRDLAQYLTFPAGRYYEDIPAIWELTKHISKFAYINAQAYYYRQRNNSIVHSSFSHKRMDQLYFGEDILRELTPDTPIYYATCSKCFFSAADNYTFVTNDFIEDKRYLKNAMKKYREFVFKDNTSGMSLKMMAAMSYISAGLVRITGRVYKLLNQYKWKKAGV